MRFQTVFEPSEEGGYTVYVPSLPGCISEGDTVEEALTNIREAIELYLESVEDDWGAGESVRQAGYAMDNRVALEDHRGVF